MHEFDGAKSRRFGAAPATGLVLLLVGVGLIVVGQLLDNGVVGYGGWLVLMASALLIIVGLIARSAETTGRRDERTDGGD
jgi:hypothetical protein